MTMNRHAVTTLIDEFAALWARASADEKKEIHRLVEIFFETPTTRLLKKQADEILTFLNEKTRCNYRHIETNLRPIVSLLRSGVLQEQMYAVIAMMCRKWANDPKMEDYLRPATLFNKTKFESYLGRIGRK